MGVSKRVRRASATSADDDTKHILEGMAASGDTLGRERKANKDEELAPRKALFVHVRLNRVHVRITYQVLETLLNYRLSVLLRGSNRLKLCSMTSTSHALRKYLCSVQPTG